ncbi:DUF5105 domain-containing protein [Clostridium sp. SHJSY1]|uniref:DUF5105 domain-containing protein n=1 Tax=Clostridium sp. SHJSY1 TaxID=2942483 RepID=UPI002875ED0A|nr:DUF5105 domain-containing protein [Clostridium sp. SHJSY1]MDS0528355.1 DUF5105 domain-containing protein [Clostridium sp. SHJSY1]
MKKIKVIGVVILILVISVLIFSLWRGFNHSPEESAKIYLDVIFKADKSNIKKIGINEEDYNVLRKKEEDILMTQLQNSSLACVLSNPEKYKHIFLNNIMNGLSQLKYEVKLVSTSNDTAKITIKTNYFELREIIKEGQEKMSEKSKNMISMTSDEMISESYKIVEEEFKKGPKEGTDATVTVCMVKKNNVWVPDENFTRDVCEIILK